MNSAAGQSPEFSDSSTESEKNKTSKLKAPPTRPALVSPPQRPVSSKSPDKAKPGANQPDDKAQSIEDRHQEAAPAPSTSPEPVTPAHPQPIAPPSEPMQYRAIGLVQGTYTPDEEQFNHGNVTTGDGALIDAVLLGRVTSLVKKHIDLEKPHLWVVYPRTRRGDEDSDVEQDLHIQIVGVWEPETLGLPGEDPASKESLNQDSEVAADDTGDDMTAPMDTEVRDDNLDTVTQEDAGATEAAEAVAEAADTQETAAEATAAESENSEISQVPTDIPPVDDNYFSIRGEVVKYAEDEEIIMVKILQGAKRPGNTRKAFRLVIRGKLTGRTVGYFWDFDVKREGTVLVMNKATPVGIVPPKKTKKRKGPPGSGGRPRRSVGGAPRPQKPARNDSRPDRAKGRPLRSSKPTKDDSSIK